MREPFFLPARNAHMAIARRQFDTFAECDTFACIWSVQSRVPYANKQQHRNMPMRPSQLDELCITFSSGLPVNLSKSKHSLVWSLAAIRSNKNGTAPHRWDYWAAAPTSDSCTQHPAPRVSCHDSAYTNHKNMHIIQPQREWQSNGITHVANMLCAPVICVRRSDEKEYIY